MPNGANYYIKETYRLLELALIGARKSSRKYIEQAIESLVKYEKELKNESKTKTWKNKKIVWKFNCIWILSLRDNWHWTKSYQYDKK